MTRDNSEFWNKARAARDKLEDQFLHHPDVTLIDIGHPPERANRTEEPVLRIHVSERWMNANPDERLVFPEVMDGIQVIVMLGDYGLDTDAPQMDEG